ncbi:MAG: 50S ribosomal protein L32, partial [Planctomycetia bacterium]|nr:50S ribosomal protein L32 [Planctomycetia bacterium]
GSRRAHDFKKPATLVSCPECSKNIPPHVVCPNCGHYMGRPIVNQEG